MPWLELTTQNEKKTLVNMDRVVKTTPQEYGTQLSTMSQEADVKVKETQDEIAQLLNRYCGEKLPTRS